MNDIASVQRLWYCLVTFVSFQFNICSRGLMGTYVVCTLKLSMKVKLAIFYALKEVFVSLIFSTCNFPLHPQHPPSPLKQIKKKVGC